MKNFFICLLVFASLVTKAQVPNAPTNLVVTPINTGGMVQFTAPANDGGDAIPITSTLLMEGLIGLLLHLQQLKAHSL